MDKKLIKNSKDEKKKEENKNNDSKWKQFTQKFSTNTFSMPERDNYKKF